MESCSAVVRGSDNDTMSRYFWYTNGLQIAMTVLSFFLSAKTNAINASTSFILVLEKVFSPSPNVFQMVLSLLYSNMTLPICVN